METSSKFKAEAIEYPIKDVSGDNTCLSFKIHQQLTPLSETASRRLSSQYILFILDVSGSMSGTALKTCIEVLKGMFNYLYEELGNTQFDLLTFNTTTNLISLKDLPLEARLKALNKVVANGGTKFLPVFNMVSSLLEDNKDQNLSIMFLSDGQAEPIDTLKGPISSLNAVFQTMTRSCEFHTLGFTSSHDSRVLNELTLAGTAQGTFQYIQSSQDIKGAMDCISGLFASKKLYGELIIKGIPEPIKVSFDDKEVEDEKSKIWEGIVFLDIPFKQYEEARETLRLRLQGAEGTEECKVAIRKETAGDENAQNIKLNLLALHETLKKITFRLTKEKVSQEEAEAINVRLNGYRKSLEDYIREIFKVKIASREPLFELVEDLRKYLRTFTELVRSNFLNQLNNEQIAKLNSMAYRNVTRQGLLKKLDKRALKSVPIINEAFEKVKELSKTVDEKALTTEYKDLIDKIGSCALTCYNFVEALQDEDCLCISFDIARPEIAVADATRIKIKNVFPTIISARSFMDSAKFALNKDSEASGGFDESKQGSIVKGISSENITAALPIYICEPHWKIASLLMKPILGWDITLDPVGYSYFQKKTVPFMLLAHTIKMKTESPGSEFSHRIHELMLETCIQIIKDDMEPSFGGTMKEEVTTIQEKYLIDGSVRTLDQVQNSFVHLSHLYCFVKMGLLSKPSKEDLVLMLKYMAEEELRRRQSDWDQSKLAKYLEDYLRINVQKYLSLIKDMKKEAGEEKQIVKEPEAPILCKNEEDFKLNMLRKLYETNPEKLTPEQLQAVKASKGIKDEEKKVEETKADQASKPKEDKNQPGLVFEIPKTEFLDGDKLSDLDTNQRFAHSEYEELYKTFNKELFTWIKFFFPEDELNLEDFSSLEKIGINSSAKFMCLYVQNKMQGKNADRKKVFETKKYANPWEENASVDFLTRVYRKIILGNLERETKSQKQKKKVGGVQNAGTLSDMELFAQTDDLYVAAGILANGLTLGQFHFLQDVLRSEKESNSLVLEKLKMIRDRSYDGIEFNFDFTIRKRFMRKLFKTYILDYKYHEWLELWHK